MKNKKLLLAILILLILLNILLVFYILTNGNYLNTSKPNSKIEPTIVEEYIEPTETEPLTTVPVFNDPKCNTEPDTNGKCPPGCANFGIPLGCVTQEYLDYCNAGNPCPQ